MERLNLNMYRPDAPTIFRLAGFSTEKSQWFSGVNNISECPKSR